MQSHVCWGRGGGYLVCHVVLDPLPKLPVRYSLSLPACCLLLLCHSWHTGSFQLPPDPTRGQGCLSFHQPSCLCSHAWDVGYMSSQSGTHWPSYLPPLSLILPGNTRGNAFLRWGKSCLHDSGQFLYSFSIPLWDLGMCTYLRQLLVYFLLFVLVDISLSIMTSETTVGLGLG